MSGKILTRSCTAPAMLLENFCPIIDVIFVIRLVSVYLPCLFVHLQSGWKENHTTFVSELKALQANGLSSFSVSVREAFKLLNIHRLHTGIENYGQVTGITYSIHVISYYTVLGSQSFLFGTCCGYMHYRWTVNDKQ